jgi:type IV pilus assembly protein PilN
LIRVNLLPHAADRRAAPESSQAWLLLVMLVVVIEIVGLFFYHQTKEEELTAATAEVQKVTDQINDIKQRVKDHEKIKTELEELRAREEAIAKLQAARKGPTAVLLELSHLLTKGKGPTLDPAKLDQQRQENPNAIWNPSWDPKRVWLTAYQETERNVRLEGVARDAADVSELATRLKLSQYFEEVTMLPGEQKQQTKSSKDEDTVELVKFALQVKVNY